jgi:tRNA pseudouridine38-40 synthase
VAKTYEYRILREESCSPFLARYVLPCLWKIDLALLQESARIFLGEHDFLSFAATDPDRSARDAESNPDEDADGSETGSPGAVRTIFSSEWEERQTESGALLVYRVRGNGFLHHMVRNLVGTMLDVGRGQLPLTDIPKILAARTRSAAGPTAPARGLFLHSVEYDQDAV